MENFILQPLVWPDKPQNQELYLRTDGSIRQDLMGQCVVLKKGQLCRFDTYFNAFSAGKWAKYTTISNLQLELTASGDFSVRLFQTGLKAGGHKTAEKLVCEKTFQAVSGEKIRLSDIQAPETGILYFEIEAISDEVEFRDFAYFAVMPEASLTDVHLSAVICTYKRELYVEENLRRIEKEILSNERSPLYNRLSVFVSDNGQTLKLETMPQIQIKKNKNLGGVGGFTRGMIETLEHNKAATHVLLMDDDAIILPHVLERTFRFLSLLKPEYAGYTIAGALLRQDKPDIQFESGAQWNRGKIKALKNELDLKRLEKLVENETEDQEIEYAGWWYSCIPVSVIKEIGLPLPLFIHRDDIEYGLRMNKRFITLNGVGIWHEPYLNKMPGVLEYYDVRNMAIINAIHYEDYSKAEFKRMLLKWMMGNIFRFRYRYVGLNAMGVRDFCKGWTWLEATDAQKLHAHLREMDYKLQPEIEFYQYHGLAKKSFEGFESGITPPVPSWKKQIALLTLNGTFLPPVNQVPYLSKPYGDVYQLFRRREVVFVDNEKKCLLVKRSLMDCFKSIACIQKTFSLLDKGYAIQKDGFYRQWERLTSVDAWKKILEINI